MSRAISIADVLRTLHALAPHDDDERRAITRLLGYDIVDAAPAPVTAPRVQEAQAGPDRILPKHDVAEQERPVDPDAPATEAVRLPDIVRNRVVLPPPIARPAAVPSYVPSAPPLLAAEWSAAILARLGARLDGAGGLDLPRLIARIARRAPIQAVPRRLRLVTAPMITVVLDESGVMLWLSDDQAALVRQLRATLRPPIEVVSCDGPPIVTEPGGAQRRDYDDDAPPPNDSMPIDFEGGPPPSVRIAHGARVLAVTDLGAGSPWRNAGPERPLEWRRFARDLAAHGASLVILTPIPAARRPPELRALRCVHWDRRTRPSEVHALVKELR